MVTETHHLALCRLVIFWAEKLLPLQERNVENIRPDHIPSMCSMPDVVIEDWFVPNKKNFARKSENFFASHVTVGVLWVGVGCPLWTQPLRDGSEEFFHRAHRRLLQVMIGGLLEHQTN